MKTPDYIARLTFIGLIAMFFALSLGLAAVANKRFDQLTDATRRIRALEQTMDTRSEAAARHFLECHCTAATTNQVEEQ